MLNECAHSSPRWFALYVRVRHERAVGVQLEGRGLEAFLPCYLSRRKWADRYVSLELPLFPGYVFCRFSGDQRASVLDTTGVIRIVGFGRQLMPVDDEEMHAIQKAIAAGLACEPVPYVEVGHAVRIQSGPLAGVDGILQTIKDGHRLVLSITILNRSVQDGVVFPLARCRPAELLLCNRLSFAETQSTSSTEFLCTRLSNPPAFRSLKILFTLLLLNRTIHRLRSRT